MLQRIQKRTAEVLHAGRSRDPVARLVDISLVVLITLNVVAVILASEPEIYEPLAAKFYAFEVFSVGLFTLEYVMRIWSVTENPWHGKYRHPVLGRIRYMFSVMALVDLIAILPFYLAMFISIDLRFLRVIRLLRILKLTRYSSAMTMLFDVFRAEARIIASALFVLMLLLVVASSCIYLAEHRVQPEDFGTIPRSMWWAIVTMTTVGYGDVVPVTATGRFIGALMGVIGIGMVALPAGILASGFNRAMHSRYENLRREVDHAFDNGSVDASELQALEARCKKLGLAEQDLRDLMLEISKFRQKRLVSGERCPNCGKNLGPSAAGDRLDGE